MLKNRYEKSNKNFKIVNVVSIVIIFIVLFLNGLFNDDDTFSYKSWFSPVKNENGDLNYYLSRKQTISFINELLSKKEKDVSLFSRLIFRLKFSILKNGLDNNILFSFLNRTTAYVLFILSVTYLIIAFNLIPTVGDISGIKEVNGSFYFYERDCFMSDVSRGGNIERDCYDNVFGDSLTQKEIDRYYQILEEGDQYIDKYFFFLSPPFDFGLYFNFMYAFLFFLWIIASLTMPPNSLLSKNYQSFRTLIISKENKIFHKNFLKNQYFNVLLIKYLFGQLSEEENFYFECHLYFLSLDAYNDDRSVENLNDKFNFNKYIEYNHNQEKNKIRFRQSALEFFIRVPFILLIIYLFYIKYYFLGGLMLFFALISRREKFTKDMEMYKT